MGRARFCVLSVFVYLGPFRWRGGLEMNRAGNCVFLVFGCVGRFRWTPQWRRLTQPLVLPDGNPVGGRLSFGIGDQPFVLLSAVLAVVHGVTVMNSSGLESGWCSPRHFHPCGRCLGQPSLQRHHQTRYVTVHASVYILPLTLLPANPPPPPTPTPTPTPYNRYEHFPHSWRLTRG